MYNTHENNPAIYRNSPHGLGGRLVECVPNFSEGRNPASIRQITGAIEAVAGVRLLHVDTGWAANRTVVTFAGTPEAVCEAAFRAVEKASEVIDMRRHHGEHPRFGATDVLPLVPVAGVTMEETTAWARALGERIGNELGIPVYAYEFAAFDERRRNLAYCRKGEYEGLEAKLATPEGKPDFGPDAFVPATGAIAVGARRFLVAYNVNLNTDAAHSAAAIACEVREKGRTASDGSRRPGLLKAVKAIGWTIEEYGIAQVSMNLCDLAVTPLHAAFEAVCERAQAHGLRVTGSELVGLVPLQAMLDAGNYFWEKQPHAAGATGEDLVQTAVRRLGLDELAPFDPKKRIVEYVWKEFTDLQIDGFTDLPCGGQRGAAGDS